MHYSGVSAPQLPGEALSSSFLWKERRCRGGWVGTAFFLDVSFREASVSKPELAAELIAEVTAGAETVAGPPASETVAPPSRIPCRKHGRPARQ